MTTEDWLEHVTAYGFRVWHLIFMIIASIITIVVCICCCIRFRVPRTKQEIEADYIRKQMTNKFYKQLKLFENSEMDGIDMRTALERVMKHFEWELECAEQQNSSEVMSKSASQLFEPNPDDCPLHSKVVGALSLGFFKDRRKHRSGVENLS